MNEQKQVVKIKRRRSRAEVEQLVAEYETSGLGRTAFCQEKGLSLSTLARYRRRQDQMAGGGAEESRWISVEVSGSGTVVGEEKGSGLAVVVSNGRRIEVSCTFDGDTLQRLLAVVERS